MSLSPSNPVQRRSDAIAISRVICILGVVYVHAWTGLSGSSLEALRGSGQENLRWVLMECLGRSAVPLLGLISGWLVAGSRQATNWSDHVRRKARTILLPMVLWNVIAIILVSSAVWFLNLKAPTPQSPAWLVEELFIVTRNPDINVQMPFLRDLFLCMVAAPLLLRLPTTVLAGVALIAAACHVTGIGAPVLMRASILMFFVLGIMARRGGWAEKAAALRPWVALVPFALLMGVQLYLATRPGHADGSVAQATLDLGVRISAALAFWRMAWALADGGAMRDMLLRIEPFAFFLFCAHLILIWLGGPLIGRLTGPMGAPLYPLYLLFQPLIVLAVVILIARGLQQVAPGAAAVLSGGRLGAGPQAASHTVMA